MALVSINDLTIGFRGPTLLQDVNCQIEAGQRIGLLGRNGAGKTTFMRLLGGDLEPDHGEILLSPGARVARLQQDVPRDCQGSVADMVGQGFAAACDENRELHEFQWRQQHAVEKVLSRMGLEGSAEFAQLSSGMKRRVLLASAIVAEPELLLLDEPTNHLDIESIKWLENFLLGWRGTLLFVTHDRMFLRRLATRILEIDRGQLFDWSCDYDTFLRRKEAALEAQQKQDALFDRKLAEEEAWIRQGIKARRTRNEGRVRALESMREQRQARRGDVGRVRLNIQQGERSGNLIADLDDVSFAYENNPVFSHVSTTIMRGDKVGIVGANGTGKTTLLRVLLGKIEPQSGKVRLGSNLQIAYFDQLRETLDEKKSVVENVGDGYDTIQVGGKSKHVIGYLQDFLFTPERARTEVRFLSGGERNRILLARLFAKPANVIVLDEPTNDLDTETLELLEERLVEFTGTVLVVSHDREFLNRVVTSTLVFENASFKEYVGGYDDWLRQAQPDMQEPQDASPNEHRDGDVKRSKTASPKPKERARKLSYKEQRELESLPGEIEALEAEIQRLHEEMALPEFYQQDKDSITATNELLQKKNQQLTNAYQRWEALEAIVEASNS